MAAKGKHEINPHGSHLGAIHCSTCHAGQPPAAGRYSAKTRYRQADSACALHWQSSLTAAPSAQLVFDEAQWAVTPGQSAVLYDGEVCLGGGVIEASS